MNIGSRLGIDLLTSLFERYTEGNMMIKKLKWQINHGSSMRIKSVVTAALAICLGTIVVLVIVRHSKSASRHREIVELFQQDSSLIKKYCGIYSLSPRKYVSVVYGELYNSVKVSVIGDYLYEFDGLRAQLGFNPSIGVAQVKISTAEWIEKQYSDGKFIVVSRTKQETAQKLLNDTTNILYSVAYVSLIRKAFNGVFSGEVPVRTLASYYGLGIDHEVGYDTSYVNDLGIFAQEFYESDELLHLFPKSDDSHLQRQ